MMVTILASITIVFFILCGILHLYWFLGGKTFLKNALPTRDDGSLVLSPSKFSVFIVACGFFFCALLLIAYIRIINITAYIPHPLIHYFVITLSIIMFIRAIGDFNYVGIFKKVKKTDFAFFDTTLYIPLCLVIGSILLSIFLLQSFSNPTKHL